MSTNGPLRRNKGNNYTMSPDETSVRIRIGGILICIQRIGPGVTVELCTEDEHGIGVLDTAYAAFDEDELSALTED